MHFGPNHSGNRLIFHLLPILGGLKPKAKPDAVREIIPWMPSSLPVPIEVLCKVERIERDLVSLDLFNKNSRNFIVQGSTALITT